MEELKFYRKAMEKYPLLTKEQETELIADYFGQDGKKKEKAREMLINSNLRLVVSHAVRQAGRGIDVSDLVQEGNIGFQKALDKFDPSKGLRLSTYATYWIRQSMTRYIKDRNRTVHVPEYVINAITQMSRFECEFKQTNGRNPTDAEIMKATGLQPEILAAAKKSAKTVISMQSAAGEDGTEFGELMTDKCAKDAADLASVALMRAVLENVLATLTPYEKKVVRMRYGICDMKPMTVSQAANYLSTTEDEIRRAEKAAIGKLSRKANAA